MHLYNILYKYSLFLEDESLLDLGKDGKCSLWSLYWPNFSSSTTSSSKLNQLSSEISPHLGGFCQEIFLVSVYANHRYIHFWPSVANLVYHVHIKWLLAILKPWRGPIRNHKIFWDPSNISTHEPDMKDFPNHKLWITANLIPLFYQL